MAASASPAWMASASRSIPPPKRWTVPSTTMPSPTATSDAGATPSTGEPVASSTAARTLGLMRGTHGGRADDVSQNRARLDRGELARVADEDQSRLAPDGFGQPRHQRQRHHRRLVDDHDVVGQPVPAVVAEAAVGAGLPAEQAVERRGLELEQPRADCLVDAEPSGFVVDRLRESRGGLAGRGGERDERRCVARGERLLLEQRDDAGDRGGLAGARAAGHDREAAEHCRGGCLLLAGVGVLALEQPLDAIGEQLHVDGARRAGERLRGRPRPAAPLASSGRGRGRCLRGRVEGRPRRDRSPRRKRSRRTGSGHGRVVRSIGSSTSTVAVSWIRSRSTKTCPMRGARTASAAASRTESSVPPIRSASRRATWTSAAASTPASLNSSSSPETPRARRASKRSVTRPPRGRGRRSAPRPARATAAR